MSKDAIKYISSNLNKDNYISMFIAGSIPEKLIPTSDLDIILVIKGCRKNQFFNNLKKIMDSYVKQNNSVKYSFFRGPLKYKYKGLIHFVIYTQEKNPNYSRRVEFVGESIPVLKSFLKKSKMVDGLTVKELLEEKNMKDQEVNKNDTSNMQRKFKMLLEKNKLSFKCWKNINGEWKFRRETKTPSNFLREELLRYYSKNLK